MKVRSGTAAVIGSLGLTAVLTVSGCGFSRDDLPLSASDPSAAATQDSTTTKVVPAPRHETLKAVPLKKYGIAYKIPRGWTTLDGSKLLTADSPVVKHFAEKTGRSPEEVAALMKSAIDTYAISDAGMHNGFVDNVNSTGTTGLAPDEDQIKQQLTGLGATLTRLIRPRSPLGEVTRVSYTLTLRGATFYAVFLGIDTGKGFVGITNASSTQRGAEARATEIQNTLVRLG
jgi:hypothetical protein